MLQAANTELFNPSVPKAHNSECQNILISFKNEAIESLLKLVWWFFIFCTLGTNGLTDVCIECVQLWFNPWVPEEVKL